MLLETRPYSFAVFVYIEIAQRVQIVGQRLVHKHSYCMAFPSIQMFFTGSYVGGGEDLYSEGS
jgi:hypothetical protein